MADVTYYKGYIGEEDLNIGLSTFVRRDKDGAYRQLTQINKDTFKIDWYFDVRDYADFPTAVTELNAYGTNVCLLISEECVVDADVTCNAEVYLKPIKDGLLNVSSGYTVTVDAPLNIIDCHQKIFSGSGTVAFSKIGEINPAWYGVSVDETGGNNSTNFAKIITGMVAGSSIKFNGEYTISGNLTISKACTIFGYTATFTWASDTTASRGLLVTASNVKFYGLTLDGPQHDSQVATQVGIYAYGADASNYITGLKIKDCEITDWTYGIQGAFIQDFDILDNYLYDLYSVGMSLASASDGKVCKNHVKDILGSVGGVAYGIAITRTAGAIATYPRSSDIIVSENIIDNVDLWEGLDTHSGQNITFANNIVKNCKIGIAGATSNNESSVETYAPLELTIIGNKVMSGVTDGTAYYGIVMVGAGTAGSVTQYATGSIVGNFVKGHGAEATATHGGIVVYKTQNLKIADNILSECGSNGIELYYDNDGFNITGNTITDVWSNTRSSNGIQFDGRGNKGYCGGNSFHVGSKSATYVMTYAIITDTNDVSPTDCNIILGPMYSECTYDYGGDWGGVGFDKSSGGMFTIKHVISYADFAAAVTHDGHIDLPAGAVVTDVWWSLDTEFSGGAVSAATLQYGVAVVDTDGFFPAEDIFTGAGTGYKDSAITSRGVLLYSAGSIPIEYFCTANTVLRATITLTGDTGNHLEAGQVTIWTKGYRVK